MSRPVWGLTRINQALLALSNLPSFDPEETNLRVEIDGLRLSWHRWIPCPCPSANEQTRRPDPVCPLCFGRGDLYFAPENYEIPADAGDLTELQRAIIADDGCVIRGMCHDFERDETIVDPFGVWSFGAMSATVRHENPLSYLDRLVLLDGSVPYAEVVVQPDLPTTDSSAGAPAWRNTRPPTVPNLPLRYRAQGVNLIRSLTKFYLEDEDFDVVVGRIVWRAGREPEPGTRLSVHYLAHPAYVVQSQPHIVRQTNLRLRVPDLMTPAGSPIALPIRAICLLEQVPPKNAVT